MKSANPDPRRAAWTALFCLSLAAGVSSTSACGDEAVSSIPDGPAEPLDADPATLADAASDPEPAPDEDLPAVAAELSVWPITLEVFEILDATFEGERLLLATAAADGISLVRFEQKKDGPSEVERRLIGPNGTPLALITIGGTNPRRAALWIEDGHLRALRLDGPLSASPSTVAAEEGGAFAGPLAVGTDDLSALACLSDGNRPLCLRLDSELTAVGLHPFERRNGELARWVGATDTGWLVMMARCRNESCGRESLEVLTLNDEGAQVGKSRSLPDIEGTRDAALIPTGDGLVLVGRRRGAGEHTAWHIAHGGVMELDGRFSRVVGGFSLNDTTMLVERGHLRMRQGFPVSSIDLRPLKIERRKALRHEKKKVERERFPDTIARHLPTEVDQRFGARGDTLVFASPRRKGLIKAAVVRVSEVKRPDGT